MSNIYLYLYIYFSDSQLRRIVKDGVKQIPMILVVRYELISNLLHRVWNKLLNFRMLLKYLLSLQFCCVSFIETQKVCSTAAPICEEGCLLVKDASDGCLECSCDGGM